MVLKIEEKNEKIVRAKKRLKKLHTKYCDLIDKLGYFRALLKDYKKLSHRCNCPLCSQKIDSKEFEKQIPELEWKIKIIEAWIDQNYSYSKRGRIERPIADLRYKKEKEHKQQVQKYLTEKKNKLNKTIRTFELPNDIETIEEKELWNEAMQFQLDKRGIEEDDDFEFEILT
jgi:hypothetical protein